MKCWPKDPKETVNFEEILDPVADLYRRCAAKPDKDHKYHGYKHGPVSAATCLDGEHLGEADVRKRSEEDHGRDIIDMFLALAFQLGAEQGRRYANGKGSYLNNMGGG